MRRAAQPLILVPMLYRVTDQDELQEVATTTMVDENLYESRTEDWVARRPEVLGESLLLIGRQIQLDQGKDRIDLLALDKSGNLVVIELKRDWVGGTADLQALRYAALVSQWTLDDIRRQAEDHWKSVGVDRGTFIQAVEEFCEETYELNAAQRIILAGRDVKPRLGSMALWLRSHGIDVRVVAISLFKDGEQLYLQPQVVIPPPSETPLQATIAIGSSDKPWLIDGKTWHLEQRCSAKGREIVERIVTLIAEAVPDADGPDWAQKHYIAWRSGMKTWARVATGANQARLTVDGLAQSPAEIAKGMGYAVFAEEADLAEKLALGSSVALIPDGRIRFTIKSSSDLEGERAMVLCDLLRESWMGFTGEEASTQPDDLDETDEGA